MKVGSLVFATEQGLGYLAKSFYDAGVVTDVMVVVHGKRQEQSDWYPNATRIRDLYSTRSQIDLFEFCRSMNTMLFFETPFVWQLINICKELGVKTVLMPMHECMPAELPAIPDLMLCPSLLEVWAYKNFEHKYLPVPVSRPFKLREYAHTFVHNAGHGGLRGRNGTMELLRSFKHLKKEANFIIRSQEPLDLRGIDFGKATVDIRIGSFKHDTLYAEGDVFVFPEKFNGLSLPMQEAFASGMPIIATNREPMSSWLPKNLLFDPVGFHQQRVSPRCRFYSEAIIEPQAIAAKIDEVNGAYIGDYSKAGEAFAERMSWDNLKQAYLDVLK